MMAAERDRCRPVLHSSLPKLSLRRRTPNAASPQGCALTLTIRYKQGCSIIRDKIHQAMRSLPSALPLVRYPQLQRRPQIAVDADAAKMFLERT